MKTIVPILLYHGVSSSPSTQMADFTVTPERFSEHMDILVAGGFKTLTVTRFATELRTGVFEQSSAGKKVALVTFDDGYADFAEHALPAMEANDIASTVYVTTGFLSGGSAARMPGPSDKMLDWHQLPELVERNVEIGGHSHSHPQMDTLLPGRAWEELIRCKALLEDAIETGVRSFAYPHGYNSPRLRRQTQLAGYDSAAAVRNVLSHTEDDLFRIARLTVKAETSTDQLRSWLDGNDAPVAEKREQPRTWGWRNYRYAKAIVQNKAGSAFR